MVKVSVVCPSLVRTHIINSVRNRPVEYLDDTVVKNLKPPEEEAVWADIESDGQYRVITPEEAAECVFKGIREERLYILTHPESREWVRERMENIVNERNPKVKG